MIVKTAKQRAAINLIGRYKYTLLEGGSRSGKTFITCYGMVVRGLHYPESWHLAGRLRLSHARTSLWLKTFPDVFRAMGIWDSVKKNNKDMFFELPGGSQIWVAGFDDKDRVEKILGNEYATIFLNESSQLSYDTFDTVTTRLNAPKHLGIPLRFILDYNPPSQSHWGYKIFHKRLFPDGRAVPENDYQYIKMNPGDNVENLSKDYIETLKNLSPARRRRFLEGEYGTDEGSLWRREWIKYEKAPVELVRVVVGVDPSGSSDGDEIGIVVAGRDCNNRYYVLADYSLHGTPEEWAQEVFAAYTRYQADVVVAEKNYGGEMVSSVITQFKRVPINVKLVNASRGKAVRAEPISAMYQRGEVFHAEQLPELEDELCTWKPADDDSPNRLDAAVWTLTELSSGGVGLEYV